MALSKMTKIGNKWQRVALTPEEMNTVLENLVEFNSNEFKRCLATAEKIDKKDRFNIAVVLFDKQGLASFTAMSEALEEKLNAMRDEAFGKTPPAPKPDTAPTPVKVEDNELEKIKTEVEKKPVVEPDKPTTTELKPHPDQVPQETKGLQVEERVIDVPEKKETEKDVADDVFGQSFNPEKGKYEPKGESK